MTLTHTSITNINSSVNCMVHTGQNLISGLRIPEATKLLPKARDFPKLQPSFLKHESLHNNINKWSYI